MFPLSRLTELTPQKQMQFIKRGITTVEELATLFPRTYYDFRQVSEIKDLNFGDMAVVYGKVIYRAIGSKSNTLTIQDKNGNSMLITWFHSDYVFRQFQTGDYAYFCGKVTDYNMSWNIVNPVFVSMDEAEALRIYPVYTKYKGMSEAYLRGSIRLAISFLEANRKDFSRDLFARSLGLMEYIEAIKCIHDPLDNKSYTNAQRRMAFEQIYDFYDSLSRKEQYRIAESIGPLRNLSVTTEFIQHGLPFQLTQGQLETLRTITRRSLKGERIHSIVSGDVGCGKTIVALISAILMAENGFQTVITAPTLVLANQHFQEMTKLTKSLVIDGHPLRIALLTGETKKRERNGILKKLSDGELDILIGTHAVFSSEITFAKLGMTIIDEEQKFGVEQKAALEERDKEGAHHLSMTATPIPRSIAMTVYARDSDVLRIETPPKGRKPTITRQCYCVKDAFDVVREQIDAGHQAYIVCPFIEQSDNDRFQDVVSVTTAEDMLREYIRETPGFQPKAVSINGAMKQAEIVEKINLFATGQADILLSTTIVEVGVNVPNATVICIMSASRFGLSGLHQLRGRVGRGVDQGICLLCDERQSEKLDVLCATNNGFEIAEHDLKMRGPGDLTGEAQTGDNETIELIIRRPNLSRRIKEHFFPTQHTA